MEATTSRPLYTLPPPESDACPWLHMLHGKRWQRQTFVSISQNRYHTKIIPETRDMFVCYSYKEWLVLSDFASKDMFLFSIESLEKIRIPPINVIDYSMIFLTSLPSDPQCHVLFMCHDTKTVAFCRLYDDEYTKHTFEEEDLCWFQCMTIFEGKIIGYRSPIYLLTIEFQNSKLRIAPLVTINYGPTEILNVHKYERRYYLIDFFGDLVLVQKYINDTSPWDIDFKIYKLDTSSGTATEMKSIGENVIFLDNIRHGKCCRACGPKMKRNSIYFVELDDYNLYVFDLELKSIATSVPCPLARSCFFSWVMPPFSHETSRAT